VKNVTSKKFIRMPRNTLEGFNESNTTKEAYYSNLAKIEGLRVDYEIQVNRFVPGYKEVMIPRILQEIKQKKVNSRIIDLGCGPGGLSTQIYKEINPREMIWLDENSDMVKAAKQTAETESVAPVILEESIEDFEYEGEFDIVNSSLTLHNISNKIKSKESISKKELVLRKVFNMLRPGGTFIWTDLICFTDKVKQEKEINYRKQYAIYKGADPVFVESSFKKEAEVDFPLTSQETKEILKKIGFNNIYIIWEATTFLTISARKP